MGVGGIYAGNASQNNNPPYGNVYLWPILGGSGGGGGGAIFIASSSTITLNGTITARGGHGGDKHPHPYCRYCGYGGGGSGGAIRIMANVFNGTGAISTKPGELRHVDGTITYGGRGSHGRVRVESFTINYLGSSYSTIKYASPGKMFPLSSISSPSVRVVTINGIAVPQNPTGFFDPPDLVDDITGAVTLEIEAINVPIGTVVHLTMGSENGGTVNFDSTPLAGTLENSTATALVTVPYGYSRFTLRATF